MRIRIRDLESFLPWIRYPGSGMGKYPDSATLVGTVFRYVKLRIEEEKLVNNQQSTG
jgi:hypothetical protein